MATYRSTAAATDFVPYDRPEGAAICQEFSLTIGAAVANGDIFILGKLPPQSTLLALDVQVPTLDSGTNNATLTVKLGDSEDDDAFSNASATATFHNTNVRINNYLPANTIVNTTSRGTLFGSLPKSYTNAADIRLTIAAAANTAASSGVIEGFYTYVMRPFYAQPDL